VERPIANSYWVVPGRLLAGEHPFGENPVDAHNRLAQLRNVGIDHFVDLTEPGEMPAYRLLLPKSTDYLRRAIPDMSVPNEFSQMVEIQTRLRDALSRERCVYVHCRAGIGRTGTVIGCFLVEQGLSGRAAMKELNRLWKHSERSKSWPKIPQTPAQADYIKNWPQNRLHSVT
jgi:hypothetical protein